jgi:RNA polymerase sigma factor (sigma-70 family)
MPMSNEGESVKPQHDLIQVVKTHQSRLKNFIRSRVSSMEDAEDILQETLYHLARMDSLARPVENAAAWLYRVAKNQIINRGVKKHEEVYSVWKNDEAGEMVCQDLAEILFDNDASPDIEYLHSLVWNELETALAELPAEQREVFEKTELFGLSVKETAAATGVPVNTVLSRKHYAILYLRERLRDLYLEVITE